MTQAPKVFISDRRDDSVGPPAGGELLAGVSRFDVRLQRVDDPRNADKLYELAKIAAPAQMPVLPWQLEGNGPVL